MAADYEKLGVFYLGREFDPKANALKDDLVLYDSRDLTTHAVCMGMTGSGKTGLCLSLLEEAAIDGVPAICIDPKGDLGNLMLTFPNLAPADFEPWVDTGEAARKGQTTAQFAAAAAETWRKGLAEWDEAPERIARLRAAAEVAIYTPGAETGLPLSVLRSFAPPTVGSGGFDAGALRDRVAAVVSGLLSLLGIDADPLVSREHILLANLLEGAWRQGVSLDMTGIIQAVQKPPFDKLGAFDLETFFPAKDRLRLAMQINALLASPGFATWMSGEPLDAQRLLFTAEGKPRISIISIAHLNDAERMFIVTLVLNELITWMRNQSGTSSLRAIFYMDEIFGYFPPTANPPSKPPMLTLLKQARAFGLGCVLATQNPVDLDYKGLANCGTWFIGRLQTERDKLRVIEGLKSAQAVSEDTHLEALMSNLTQRVFLMRNMHEDAPVLMKTRWALSYLRGPLTGPEIARVMSDRKSAAAKPFSPTGAAPTMPAAADGRPAIGAGISEYFLSATSGSGPVLYKPMVAGFAKLHYVDPKLNLDEWQTAGWLAPLDDGGGNASWEDATRDPQLKSRLATAPAEGAQYADIPGTALRAASYVAWAKSLQSNLYETARAKVLWSEKFKSASKPGEAEGEFRARLTLAAREQRDAAVADLRKRWQAKLLQLQDQVRRAEERRQREQSQLTQQKMQTAVNIGSSILGALLGRKTFSATNLGRVGTAARSASRWGQESQDVDRADENLDVLRQRLADTQRDLDAEVARLESSLDAATLSLTPIDVPARKSDIAVGEVALVWTPWRKGADGFPAPAYD